MEILFCICWGIFTGGASVWIAQHFFSGQNLTVRRETVLRYSGKSLVKHAFFSERCKNNKIYIWAEGLQIFIMLLLYQQYGFSPLFFGLSFFSILILSIAIIDGERGIIPDSLLGLLGIGAIFFCFFEAERSLFFLLEGFVAGGGVLWSIFLLSHGGMGEGDIKFAAVIGLWLGWEICLLMLFLAFFFGAAAGLFLLQKRKASLQDAVPFGPFLAGAACICCLYGNEILAFYQGVFL